MPRKPEFVMSFEGTMANYFILFYIPPTNCPASYFLNATPPVLDQFFICRNHDKKYKVQ